MKRPDAPSATRAIEGRTPSLDMVRFRKTPLIVKKVYRCRGPQNQRELNFGYAPRGKYVVTANLPERDGQFEYRIKHTMNCTNAQ